MGGGTMMLLPHADIESHEKQAETSVRGQNNERGMEIFSPLRRKRRHYIREMKIFFVGGKGTLNFT
jgi:hypothetical protein